MVSENQVRGLSGRGGGYYGERADGSLLNSTLSKNTAVLGGGLYKDLPGDLQVHSCQVQENTGNAGGGVRWRGRGGAIVECMFEGNDALVRGGGLYCEYTEVPVVRCFISANTSQGMGGGVLSLEASPILENCIITRNHSEYAGGGIACGGDDPQIVNCTIVGNSAADSAGNVFSIWGGTEVSVTNAIIWDGDPDQIAIADGEMLVRWSNVQGGWPGEGNIDEDPRLISRRGFDFLLGRGSPCIDAGDLEIQDGISDWHPDWPEWYPNGAASDMGAYGGPGNDRWLR
jgi:hypothetical protein